ncbi:UNVERIFIED_CONTAM: hypothetical protein PYX00_001437 [Menopon gallinae]|uniref:Uncharacterized protein n=1 Tax=Menopon gallinae TaxID=328185 RepID=A0AAW2ICW3_9NEOP
MPETSTDTTKWRKSTTKNSPSRLTDKTIPCNRPDMDKVANFILLTHMAVLNIQNFQALQEKLSKYETEVAEELKKQ